MNKKINIFPNVCILLGILSGILVIYHIFVNNPDNDMWWMMSTGRYILENKTFPKINPFIIHKDFNIIIEQPLLAILNYRIFSLFGVNGLRCLSGLFYIIDGILIYVWVGNYSNDKITKYFSLIIYTWIILLYINTRPTIISLGIMLIELIILNKVQNNYKKKYLLFWLLLLSIIEINIHSALWWMLFIIMFPYIMPNIFSKNVIPQFIKNIKLYCPIMIGMFLAGFINPYGINNILFLFKSMNNTKLFQNILEMQNPTIIHPLGTVIHVCGDDEKYWVTKDGSKCTKEEHTHSYNGTDKSYILENNGVSGCYTLTINCGKKSHTHEEWVSAENPGCYYTRFICKGHCGGHITPIINLNMNMTLQELAQEDYFKTPYFLGPDDFKYTDENGNGYTISPIVNSPQTLQEWNDYWDTMMSKWFIPFPSTPRNLIDNLARHYIQGVATFYHHVANGLRWVSSKLFGTSSNSNETDVANKMENDDTDDVFDWNGWFDIDENTGKFKTKTNSQGIQKFVLNKDVSEEYEDYYSGLVGNDYFVTAYPDYSFQNMIDEWNDWEVTFPVLGASPLNDTDVDNYIKSLGLSDNNLIDKIHKYSSIVGNYWHSEYDTSNYIEHGRVSFGTWLNSCIYKTENISYNRTTNDWLNAVTNIHFDLENSQIGDIFYSNANGAIGFYIYLGKFTIMDKTSCQFVALIEDSDCQLIKTTDINNLVNHFFKVSR